MKLLHIIAVALATTTSLSAASYVGATFGYATDNEVDYYGAFAGYVFNESNSLQHSVEIEVLHARDSEYGGSVTLTPVVLNYRLTLASVKPVTPFIGAGLGINNVHVSGYGYSDNDATFFYQVKAGVEIAVSQQLSVQLAGRYMDFGKANVFGYNVDLDDDFGIEGGLTFRF